MTPSHLPLTAPLLALLALLAAAPAASPEEPPPPAPPPAEAPNHSGDAPPPETIGQAYDRMEALRRVPLPGPGSLSRRRERMAALAAEALALPAAAEAAGEDLHRLQALCFEGGRLAEAVEFGARYLAGRGEGGEPLPREGTAHALRVRALAYLDRLPEAEEGMKAWEKRTPGDERVPSVLKTLGDGYARAGRVEEAVTRYRASLEALTRPLGVAAVSTVQALVEALTALGRVEEASRVLAGAAGEGAPGDEGFAQRMESVDRRQAMVGRPFPAPELEIWTGMARPGDGALKGRVVVWHFFAWWMQVRLDEIDLWAGFAAKRAEEGLFLVPCTRLSGFDPAQGKFRGGGDEKEEFAGVERTLREHGWKGPFATGRRRGKGFRKLGIRGLPMDVVVGRDGLVRFVQAGEEAGGALARFAAERALAEPPPEEPSDGEEPGGEPVPPPEEGR